MRARLCWLLLFLLPLQWAAAVAACDHGGPARSASVAQHGDGHHVGQAVHEGGREGGREGGPAGGHAHHAHLADPGAAAAPDAEAAAPGDLTACSACDCCHLAGSALPVMSRPSPALTSTQPQPLWAGVPLSSRPTDGLYRPPRG